MSLDPAEQFLHDLMDDTGALGRDLRDAALAKSKQGREERIEQVRAYLAERWAWACATVRRANQLTADDVHDAVDALGLGEGDTRWTGNILKGWNAVTPTGQFVPSRRKERHGAPVRMWRFS